MEVLALLPALLPILLLLSSIEGRAVPGFRDQSDFFYPASRYTASRLNARQLPLWNPLSGNGEAWAANGQNQIFYPPALFFLLKNGARAVGLFLLFHFLAAYFFFFFLLRARDATLPAAALGSSVFAFSGIAVSFSAFWNHFAGFAWIPAMAWAAQKGLKTRRQKAAFGSALALCLLAGSPEAALFGALLSAAIFAFEKQREESRRVEEGYVWVRRPGSFAAAGAVGVLLGCVTIVPLADLLRGSLPRFAAEAGGVSLRQCLSLIMAPSRSTLPWLPDGALYLQTLYLSLPILLLAAAAFGLAERGREKIFWLLAAAGALAVSLVDFRVPFRYPAKLAIPVLFCVSLLAASGVDTLRFGSRGRFRRALGLGFFAASLLAGFVFSAGRTERGTIAAAGLAFSAACFLESRRIRALLVWAGILAGAAHLAQAARPLRRDVSLETFRERPKPSRGKVLTSEDDLLAAWSASVLPDDRERVRRQVDSLEGYTNLLFGISKARTASAIPSRSSRTFMDSLFGVPDLNPAAAIAGCGEIRFPDRDHVARVLVERPLSGASFFFNGRLEADPKKALSEIYLRRLEWRRTLLVAENSRRLGAESADSRPTVASASLVSERPERLEYSVSLSRPAWFYRPQSFDRWWRATIDGRPAPIVRANGVFSAVAVPAGDHKVVWFYWPWPFFIGAGLSALGFLIVVWLTLSAEPPARAYGGRG